jgi:hypothetical protein
MHSSFPCIDYFDTCTVKITCLYISAQTLYNLDDVLAFLKLCDVPRFSECVEKTLVVDDVNDCPEVQRYMHHCVPLLQTFLYNKHGKVYNNLVTENVVEQLKEMTFSVVSCIVMRRLGTNPRVTILEFFAV